MKLSVIIPAYNEGGTIEAVVRRVQAVNLGLIEKEIIVVDDGSTEGTANVLKEMSGIQRLSHERNAGKGAALTTGFRAATGDIVREALYRSEEHTSELQSQSNLVCRLLLEKK